MRTATALFLEKGYSSTSMDEIVAVSKVSKTNIYYHFKSKEELLTAIVSQMIDQYKQMIDDIVSQNSRTVMERMSEFAMLLSERTPSSSGGCPFLTLYVQTSHEFGFVREMIGNFFSGADTDDRKAAPGSVDRHEFKSELPLSRLAALIVSTIEGSLFFATYNKRSFAAHKHTSNFGIFAEVIFFTLN